MVVFFHLGKILIQGNGVFLLQITLLDGKRSLNINIFLKQFRTYVKEFLITNRKINSNQAQNLDLCLQNQ